MAYAANSIGRTLMGELFVTDENGKDYLEGTSEFDIHWLTFLKAKKAIINHLHVNQDIEQMYAIIYPTSQSDFTYRSKKYKKDAVKSFVSTWAPKIRKAGLEGYAEDSSMIMMALV
jgi:hypothetical protein